MAVLIPSVLGEVIGVAEESVPQDVVLVFSKVVDGVVRVVVSEVDVGRVEDEGVGVEGDLVVEEAGPVVVPDEVVVPVKTVTLQAGSSVHFKCRRAPPAGPITVRKQFAQAMVKGQSLLSTHQDLTSPGTLCDCHTGH